MKALPTFFFAALLAAGFSAQAQSQSTASTTVPAAANPETTAPASTTSNDGAMIASAEPKMSAAAMRARGAGSRRPVTRGAAPKATQVVGFKDGVTMRDSKVVATESGRSTFLTEGQTVKLVTGLEVASTGVVTRTDGTTETLQEGDYISLTGRLTTAQDRTSHAQSLKVNLQEDRKQAAKKARSPLRQIQL